MGLCARFGWQCVEKNTLQCSGCGTRINYKTNPLWNTDTNNKMAESFLHNISHTHTPSCIWKENPCDRSFELLPRDTNIMRQELIENIKTWTQRDSNSFYVIPKIDPTAKQLMIDNSDNDSLWQNYSFCNDILLLSASGWYANNMYVRCRYCNKCISLHSFDYKKVLSLLPPRNNDNAFLMKINEENEGKEDGEDISDILNRELPINDTESVMHKLSKLGLRIDPNIRRSHNFQIYETKSLQKPAHFNNNSSSSTFGSSVVSSSISFGASLFNQNNQNMRWPKQSILTQSNSVSNSNSTQKPTKSKKNKKRTRHQTDIDQNEEILDKYNDQQCPRKKMRISASSCNSNENQPNNNKPRKLRKNRKRKTMDSDFNDSVDSESFSLPSSKKRKISNMATVSTPAITKKQKKSRKRKFNRIYMEDHDEQNEEDDDIKTDIMSNKLLRDNRPSKRARLDTPTVRNQLFDPINLHNDFCPFLMQHQYQQKHTLGWKYCLTLLPNDIMYIKQLAEQTNKGNQAKSRF